MPLLVACFAVSKELTACIRLEGGQLLRLPTISRRHGRQQGAGLF